MQHAQATASGFGPREFPWRNLGGPPDVHSALAAPTDAPGIPRPPHPPFAVRQSTDRSKKQHAMENIGGLRIHRGICLRQAAPPWLGAIGVALAYLGTALLSLALTGTADEVGVFWPAAGVAAGAVLISTPAARWPVLLAIVAASAAIALRRDQGLAAASPFALREGGQALLLAWFIQHHFAAPFRLDSLRSVLGFAVAAGAAATISGGLATAAVIAGRGSGAAVASTWCNGVPATALGIILVVPVLIGLRDLQRQPAQNFALLQASLMLAALAGASALAFAASSQYWYTILPLGLLLPVLLAAHGRPLFAAAAVLVFAFIVA